MENLLKISDMRLYQAKMDGRNRVDSTSEFVHQG
ncbi:hypothetical protein [Marispirochaeta sp.]